MTKFSEAFPSRYARASDLNGHETKVRISCVKPEFIGNEEKHVVYFVGKQKGLVLNKTNGNVLAQAYGDDFDDWREAEAVLYPATVDFKGTAMEAIRLKIPPRGRKVEVAAYDETSPPPHTEAPAAPFADEVPF